MDMNVSKSSIGLCLTRIRRLDFTFTCGVVVKNQHDNRSLRKVVDLVSYYKS